jgi:hypothetical protein
VDDLVVDVPGELEGEVELVGRGGGVHRVSMRLVILSVNVIAPA